MKKEKAKLILITGLLISTLLTACASENNNAIANISNGSDDTGFVLTSEQMTEDFDYLCKLFDERYPYWGEVKDNGVNKEKVYNKYKELVSDASNTTEFLDVLEQFYDELNAWQYGHFSFVTPKYYQNEVDLYMKYALNTPWTKALTGDQTEKLYSSYRDDSNKFIPLGEKNDKNETEVMESNPTEMQNVQISNHASMEVICDGTVGYIKIPSFEDTLMEQDVPAIKKFIEAHKDLSNMIIDIRGNGGGNGLYWMKAIASPNITENITTSMYYLFNEDIITSEKTAKYMEIQFENLNQDKVEISQLPEFINPSPFISEYDYFMKYDSVVEPISKEKVFNGHFWVLTDYGNASAASGFTEFCKQSGFATLVGDVGNGDDCAMDPALFALPNSGFVVRFDLFYGLNGDGSSNGATGTVPDIRCASEDALDVCLKEIQK